MSGVDIPDANKQENRVATHQASLTRHIAMIFNHFAPAARIVASSDLVLIVPERIASPALDVYDLVAKPAPIEPPGAFTVTDMVWHRRLGAHPALDWFRDTLNTLAA